MPILPREIVFGRSAIGRAERGRVTLPAGILIGCGARLAVVARDLARSAARRVGSAAQIVEILILAFAMVAMFSLLGCSGPNSRWRPTAGQRAAVTERNARANPARG